MNQSECRRKLAANAHNHRHVTDKSCKCVYFKGARASFMRCENRTLKAHNKSQCKHRSGPKKGLFKKCAR